MKNRKTPAAAWLYAAGILLVLVLQFLDHTTTVYFASTLYFGACLLMEITMLLVWVYSVRRRLLPSIGRVCIVAAGLLFIFFLAASAVNYRIAGDNDLAFKRFCWYLYYVPLLFVPTLFLTTCISIVRGRKESKRWGIVCLAASALLFGAVITNDLHYTVFVPEDPARFYTGAGYHYGPVFYVIFAFISLQMLAGVLRLAVLFRKRLQLFLVLVPLALLPCYLPVSLLAQHVFGVWFFNMPAFSILCMTCFFEGCIRFRLIPYNENYTAFFGDMRVPAVITDADLRPVYRTAVPVDADAAQLAKAKAAPVYVTPDLRLSGMPLRAGYVFFTEDESELNRMNEQLSDANELLCTEHTLIKAETELREQNARMESRGRIFAEISEKTFARQQEISRLLDGTAPDAPDFDRVIARVCLLDAWIKRSANLLLVNEGESALDARELMLALEESARYLVYLGVRMEVSGGPGGTLPRGEAFDLYHAFETLLEACLPGMRRLYVSLTAEELRLVTDAPAPEALPDVPLPVTVRTADGLTYFILFRKRGCAA